MADQHSRISVIADDSTVVIDGVALTCELPPDDNLRALQWQSGRKVPGTIERRRGGGEGFHDFARVQPYVTAWQTAKAKKDAEEAAAARARGGVGRPVGSARAAPRVGGHQAHDRR